MSPPPSKRALLAAALLLAPSTGRAQVTWSAHAVGEASIGWTDNALSQPDSSGNRVASTVLTLRPGALLLLDTVKTTQRLQYTFTSTLFLGQSEANSVGHQLDYNLLYALSSRSELTMGVGGSYGQLNIFNLMRSASSPTTGAGSGGAAGANTDGTNNTAGGLQTGGLTFLTTSIYEGYTYDISNDWRVFQGASAGSYHVLNVTPPQPVRLTIGNRFGTERRYGRDALIAEQSVGALINMPVEYNGVVLSPTQSQLLVGLAGRWRRDLNERFSSEMGTGVTLAIDPNPSTPGNTDAANQASRSGYLVGPVFGASLRFNDDFGEASIGYDRSFTPNVFLGQIYYGDGIFARGSVPFFEQTTNMRLSGGSSVVWSNLVDTTTGQLTSALRVISADLGLTWDSRAGINASLRYQYFKQTSGNVDSAPVGQQVPFDMSRNAVLFTIGGMFPYRYAPPVPRDPSSGRVDRSDRPDVSNDAAGERSNRRVPPPGAVPGTTVPNTGVPPTRGVSPPI